MNLAKPRTLGVQETIWPWVDMVAFTGHEHAATYIGAWGEEYAHQVFGGRRLQTETRAICPDLELSPGWYAEVKMIGPRGSLRMERGRYEAYRRLAKNNALSFIVILHECRAGSLRSTLHLDECMPTCLERILVFSWQTIANMVKEQAKKGWRKVAGVREYVRIPMDRLRYFQQVKSNIYERALPVSVHGHQVGYVRLRRNRTKVPVGAKVGVHEPKVIDAAGRMLEELESGYHDVVLCPIPDGRKIRMVQGRNVDWYENFRRDHIVGGRGRSLVQRRNVISCLRAMSQDRPTKGGIEERILPVIHRWIQDKEAADAYPDP